jgi:hypothetical protein
VTAGAVVVGAGAGFGGVVEISGAASIAEHTQVGGNTVDTGDGIDGPRERPTVFDTSLSLVEQCGLSPSTEGADIGGDIVFVDGLRDTELAL